MGKYLTKENKETIMAINGEEVYYKDTLFLLDYPYLISFGVKKKYSEKTWKSVLNEYFKNESNDGYWLLKEAGM